MNDGTKGQFLQILDTTKLKFEDRVCDFCNDKNYSPRRSVVFLNIKFRFVQCSNCDLVYQNPLLTSESRKHLYETAEYWDAKSSTTTSEKILNYYSYMDESKNRIKTNEYRINWITSRLSAGKRILDLGCGDGLLVSMLKDRGYKAYGIDISDSMIRIANKTYALDIIQKNAEDKLDFKEPFDAMVCYTFSNFINPSLVFKNIFMNLKKGGYFFFNFPNCDHLVSRLLADRFYAYRPSAAIIYSKKTFLSYLEKHQLKVEELKKDIQFIPLGRTAGMLNLPIFSKLFKKFGCDKTDLKIKLPMSYIGCAVRNI